MDKRRSLLSLDWVCFFLADVETGVGPFVSVYLSSVRHWDPAQVGLVLSAQSLASVAAQTPSGWLVDSVRHKPWLLVGATVVISSGAYLIAAAPSVPWQVANEVAIGTATTLVAPTIAAISRGIVGPEKLSARVGRNGAFSHAGNVVAAVAAGYLGYRLGPPWTFYLCAALGVPTIAAILALRNQDIDYNTARASEPNKEASGIRDLLQDRRVLIFAASVVLFHIANAAMLPLAGQEIGKQAKQQAPLYMTACIVTAQLVMTPVALAAGRLAPRWGHKPLFLLAFAALLARAVLFLLFRHPKAIVAIEMVDGLGTGLSGVLTVLVISSLAKGTGRFNLLQGAMQACVGAGAFLSNLLAGMAARSFGYPPAFAGLAVIAVLGALLFGFGLPETKGGQAAAS